MPVGCWEKTQLTKKTKLQSTAPHLLVSRPTSYISSYRACLSVLDAIPNCSASLQFLGVASNGVLLALRSLLGWSKIPCQKPVCIPCCAIIIWKMRAWWASERAPSQARPTLNLQPQLAGRHADGRRDGRADRRAGGQKSRQTSKAAASSNESGRTFAPGLSQ